jgi:hypothetical protein
VVLLVNESHAPPSPGLPPRLGGSKISRMTDERLELVVLEMVVVEHGRDNQRASASLPFFSIGSSALLHTCLPASGWELMPSSYFFQNTWKIPKRVV